MTASGQSVAVKRRLSARLLEEAGVVGVGIRGKGFVIYLENDDASLREKVSKIAAATAPEASLVFETTGQLNKL